MQGVPPATGIVYPVSEKENHDKLNKVVDSSFFFYLAEHLFSIFAITD